MSDIGEAGIISFIKFSAGTIVYDGTRNHGSTISDTCQKLEDNIQQYLNILRTVLNSGIVSGSTHDSLAAFVAAAEMLNGKVKAIGSSVNSTAGAFMDAVDVADGYLY